MENVRSIIQKRTKTTKSLKFTYKEVKGISFLIYNYEKHCIHITKGVVRFYLTTAKSSQQSEYFLMLYKKILNSTYLKSIYYPKICVFLSFHFMIYKELALALFLEHKLKRHFNFYLRVILKPHQLFFMCSCFLSTNYCFRHFYFTTRFKRRNEAEPANLQIFH